MTQNRRNQAAGSKEENMKRRKGLERALAMTLAAFLSFTTIANDYAIVNAEEIETTGTETVQNAENNTTGGDTAATQSQQDTAAGTGSTEQKSGTESAAAGTSTGTATSTQSEAVTTTGTATETTTETATETTTETTTETKTEAEVKKPAVDLSQDINGVTIALHADEGILPEGVQMQVKEVSSQVTDGIRESIEKDGKEKVDTVIAYDITLADKSGNSIGEEWSKDGKVQVTFSGSRISDASDNADKLEVLHVDNDGNVQNQEKSEQTNGKAVDSIGFDATHFSIYAVVSIEGISNADAVVRQTYNFWDDASTPEILSSQIIRSGEKIVSPETPTSKLNGSAVFEGWYKKDAAGNLTDQFVDFDKSIDFSGDKDATIDLFAKFSTDAIYNIYFLGEDSKTVIATKKGSAGDKIDVSDITFDIVGDKALTGWAAKDINGNNIPIENNEITLNDSDVYLYPMISDAYWISFNTNGGSDVKPEYVIKGQHASYPGVTPTKSGYTFGGWYSDSECKGKYDFNSEVTAATTLYANWVASQAKYKVFYWTENADSKDYSFYKYEEKTGNVGEKAEIDSVSVNGFQLDTEKTGSTLIAGDGSTIVNVYFDRNNYSISFYMTDHFWLDILHLFDGWKENTDLKITAKYGANIADKWPSKIDSGRYPSKWYTGTDGKAYQSGISTMPLDGAKYYHAKEAGDYTIKTEYYLQKPDGTYVPDHTDSFKSDSWKWKTTKDDYYDIEGYSVNWERTPKVNSDAEQKWGESKHHGPFNMIIDYSDHPWGWKFYYDRNTYTITFNSNVSSSQSFKYGDDISSAAPANPIPSSGKKFAGWYDNQYCEGSEYVFSGKTMPAQNMIFYAKWDSTINTVNFDTDGGNSIDPQSVAYEGKAVKPADPTKDGYKFISWCYDGNRFSFDTPITENITLKAKWISTSNFKVLYKADGIADVPQDSNSYKEGTSVKVLKGVNYDKKSFLYWEFNGKHYYPGMTYTVSASDISDNVICFNAVYGDKTSDTHLTYYRNSDSQGKDTVKHDIPRIKNNDVVKLETPANFEGFSYDGHKFTGWNTKADGTGTMYQPGDRVAVSNINADSNGLYAQWKIGTYTVKFDANATDATGTVSEETFDCGETKALTANAFLRTDHVFSSWNTATDGSGTSYADKAQVKDLAAVDGTVTLYAQWAEKTGIELTCGETEKTYDGTEQYSDIDKDKVTATNLPAGYTVEGITITQSHGKNVCDAPGYTSGAEYGIYSNGAINYDNMVIKDANGKDVTAYYKVRSTTGPTLKIDKREIKITVENASKPYDGTPLTSNKCSVSDNFVKGEGFEGINIEGSQTTPGTSNSITSWIPKSNTKMGNYNIKIANGTLTVTVPDVKRSITVTANGNTKTYDGSALTAEVKDGKQYTVVGNLYTGDKLDTIDVDGSQTDAGTSSSSIRIVKVLHNGTDVSSCYNITTAPGTLTVNKGNVTVDIKGETGTEIYDGKEHTVEGYSFDRSKVPSGVDIYYYKDINPDVTGATGAQPTVSGTDVKYASDGRTVDRYMMGLTDKSFVAESQNYNVTLNVTDGWLEIDRAEATVTADRSSKMFGRKDPVFTAVVKTAVAGEESKVAYTVVRPAAGTDEDVNTYKDAIEAKGDAIQGNYNVTFIPADFEVAKNTEDLTVTAKGATKVYDGTPLGIATDDITVTAAGQTAAADSYQYSVDGGEIWMDGVPTITNVGTSEVMVKAVKHGYSDAVTTTAAALKVTARPITVTAGSASAVYSGNTLTDTSYTVSENGLAENEKISKISFTGSISAVGSAVNHIDSVAIANADGTDTTVNYEITVVDGTLTINAASSGNNNSNTVISDSATPLAATPAQAVLGARRPLETAAPAASTDNKAVLGARRGSGTGDESNMPIWLTLMIATLGLGGVTVFGHRNRKKQGR
jgi:uncharacterized repeat protein (TIGR02543 family)